MEPITLGILGGTALAGGVLNYFSAENARKDVARERARIAALAEAIKNPEFDMTTITPAEYQLLGQFNPEMLSLIEEKAPQIVQRSLAGEQGQDAMLNSLQRLRNISNTGADAQSQAMIEQAMRNAAIQNQGQQAGILDNASRRGFAPGSGLAFAQALSSQQNANQSASQAGTQAALAAYQNRLQALKDSANLGGQIEANDLNLQGRNADIINAFNQRMADSRRNQAMFNTTNLNDAQRTNLAAQQSNQDRNTALRNQAKYEQRDFRNQTAQQQYQNQLNKLAAQTGASQGSINDIRANAQDRANLISGATNTALALGGLYKSNPTQQPSPKYNNMYSGGGYGDSAFTG
jgi:hypothetical protein